MKGKLTAKEAADLVNVPYSTFLRWLNEGIVTEVTRQERGSGLSAYRLGKRFKVKLPYTKETLKRAVPR